MHSRWLAALVALPLGVLGCGNDSFSEATTATTSLPDSRGGHVPRLVVSEGCASVIDSTAGGILVETCAEAGTDPELVWSGPLFDDVYGLMTTRAGTSFASVSPADRLVQYGPKQEFVLIQLGTDPSTTITVVQPTGIAEIGDVVLECTVPNVLVECDVAE